MVTAGAGAGSAVAGALTAEPAPPVEFVSPSSAAAALIRGPQLDRSLTASILIPATVASVVDENRILLRANAEAWMQVKDRGGSILLNRTMKPGDTWPVPRQDNLVLTTGNAGGTEILLDGASTPSLGSSGTVRRDMPLDPDLIKDGKLAATLAPQVASAHARQ